MPKWNKKENNYLIKELKEGKILRDLIKDENLGHHGYYGIEHRIRLYRHTIPEIEQIYLEQKDRETQRIYKTIHLEVPDNWTFGYISDNHLNSKFEDLATLNRCYDEFNRRGIKEVFNAGDILDGWNVYRGQIYYVDRIGVDAQVKYAIKIYPKRKGMITYFIEGNHDNHIFRSSSMRVGEMIEKERKDMKFLGVYRGDVWVRNTLIRLFHAEGGSIETYSAVRRYIGRLSKDNIPDYFLVGHYHCADRPRIRGVKCIFGKTTQMDTPYTTHKGFDVSLGAWIITAKFDEKGKITKTIEEEI